MSLEAIAINTPINEVINREYPAFTKQIYNGFRKIKQSWFRNNIKKVNDYTAKLASNLPDEDKQTIENIASDLSNPEKQKLVERYQKTGGKGFTLIELLTVMVIIGILAALLSPKISDGIELAKRIPCVSNLKNFGTALTIYSLDSDGFFPFYNQVNTASLGLIYIKGYVDTPLIYRCRADKGSPAPTQIILTDLSGTGTSSEPDEPGISYYYRDLPILRNSKENIGGKIVDSSFPLAWDWFGGLKSDSEGNPFQRSLVNHNYKGGNVLYGGGYAKWKSSKEDWGSNKNNPSSDN